jgi:DNA-binding NarL/FixJ family response regulator
MRVLLADDHLCPRAVVRSFLEQIPGVEVVAEASDGHEALELINKTTPEVVLMDISMRKLNGLQALAQATKQFPTLKIIILSTYAHEEYVPQSLQAGASGYLLKDDAATELEVALRTVDHGETYLSPRISKPVLQSYLKRLGAALPQQQKNP